MTDKKEEKTAELRIDGLVTQKTLDAINSIKELKGNVISKTKYKVGKKILHKIDRTEVLELLRGQQIVEEVEKIKFLPIEKLSI